MTSVADTRLLFFLELPPTREIGRRTRDLFDKELREKLMIPSIVVTEFMEIAGARIGQEAAKTRLSVLVGRGAEIVPFSERHAYITGCLLLSNRNVPLADAIIATYVKAGEADYVLTDDPHFKTLNTKTKWIH